MEALALRLSHLDSQAEGALRVVMFYDTLMRRRVDLPALARASAGLAECVTGIRLHGTGRTIRMSPDGRQAPAPPPPTAPTTTAPITLDDEEIGTVWLERPGAPGPLDELLMDRLAIAAAAVVERYGPARTTMADPALVEPSAPTATRRPAPERCGCWGSPPTCRSASPRYAPSSRSTRSPAWSAQPGEGGATRRRRRHPGHHPGPGPVPIRRPRGHRRRRTPRPVLAAGPHRAGLYHRTPAGPPLRRPGALALLAQVPQDAARDNPDVAAIARMAGNPEDLDTLDAYCHTGSLRRAADLLHLHHSSVARRLDQLGKTLGVDLTEPTVLLRARLALTAWRLVND